MRNTCNKARNVARFATSLLLLASSSLAATDTIVPQEPVDRVSSASLLLQGMTPNKTDAALKETAAEEERRLAQEDEAAIAGGDILTHDGVGEGVKQEGKIVEDAAKEIKEQQDKVKKAMSTPGISTAQKEKGKAMLKESKNEVGNLNKQASWLSKLGKVLDTINIVAVGAKSLGYAWECDLNGAIGVVMDEMAKKATTTLGAILASPIPYVGPVIGAGAAEELHANYTRKWIENAVDYAREEDTKRTLLGNGPPKAPPVTEIGNIPGVETEPKKLKEDAAIDRIVNAANEGQRQKEKEQKQKQDEEQDRKREEATAPILDKVAPVKVTATFRFEDEDSVAVLTFTFWNVGSLAPGYGEVSRTMTFNGPLPKAGTFSAGPKVGTFSGGPNGTMSFRDFPPVKLVNGSSIVMPGGALGTVKNPDAFQNWPKGF